MAIIAEVEETENFRKPNLSGEPHKPTSNPFTFWGYFTFSISIFTIVLVSIYPQDTKSWFQSLPNELRKHYSNGRIVKVQIKHNQSPIEVFTIQYGPKTSENVLIVHGLGCNSYSFREVANLLGMGGIHTVAMDLPGSGFSDKSVMERGGNWGGILGRFWDLYSDVKEKGLFWGFDNLVENGYVPREEMNIQASSRKVMKAIELGAEETGKVLGEVVDSVGLSPVHLVLHDSAFGLSANWVSRNLGFVRSLTLIDSSPKGSVMPWWVLEIPVAREVLIGVSVVYAKFISTCCTKWGDFFAHNVLLKGKGGREAIVGMGRKFNCSFDLEEWRELKGVKGLPIQVLWSDNWSQEWTNEGRRVKEGLPHAKFVTHSGGRWPQEDVASEVAERIIQFVLSLPATVRQVDEASKPDNHIQKPINEADNHNHAHHPSSGIMDAYGLST